MKESHLVIGLMSGTSLDGVDAALVQITGSGEGTQIKLEHFVSTPFASDVQAELLRVASQAPVPAQVISHLNFLLAMLYTEAVEMLCQEAGIDLSQVDLIGSHGQTIFHQSEPAPFCRRMLASTLQIGEASLLAENTGVTTVSDFRPRDMAAGGKGAPLIPYVDYLLFRDLSRGRVLLNVGGIANITSLPAAAKMEQVKAFDTGPGNMVIDALVRRFTHDENTYDANGSIAAGGQVISSLLQKLLADPYFQAHPPKTAGREQFGEAFILQMLEHTKTACFEDLLCTATELTAQSVASAVTRFVLPGAPMEQLIVSGGGARNQFLMQRLQAALPQLEVLTSEDLGIPTAAKEAIGFAILANETLHLHSGNVPAATGARHPVVLGKVVYGDNYQRLRDATN
ncbi:MAG: anhydro-N-acetylmuramic acid kinase [Acidobacteria bacterium]|nr:anhydro-N-acetylmuramic acid kinase [Acidobacteriota bacterium]